MNSTGTQDEARPRNIWAWCRALSIHAGLLAAIIDGGRAEAAGGAHVVDDGYVETPALCHAESWLGIPRAGGSLLHAGIGCTPAAMPRLEIDLAIDRAARGSDAQHLVAPSLKLNLVQGPMSLGLRADAFLSSGLRRVAGMGGVLAGSAALGSRTGINVNLGWQTVRARRIADDHRAFWGVQVERTLAPGVSAMAEGFGLGNARAGVQGGLRWTPRPGRMDLDLLVSRGPGNAGSAITLGLTGRW